VSTPLARQRVPEPRERFAIERAEIFGWGKIIRELGVRGD
jgi:hypothetical protein